MTARPRGRPRSDTAHEAILKAACDLLASGGYERMTMEAIAARAGVSKPTLYRRWPSKSAVVAEAVLSGRLTVDSPPPPDSGDAVTDLRRWLRQQFERLGTPAMTALVRGLTAAAVDSDVDAARLYDHLTGPSRSQLKDRLAAGVRQGQLRPETDLDAVADTVTGTLLYRAIARGSATVPDADHLLDLLLTGISMPPDTRSEPTGTGLEPMATGEHRRTAPPRSGPTANSAKTRES
ncbi:TetR/AcrR family transcriptional regulator [Streptomyces chartreusis]|uniref:TetR/AcrR family transcriptional regulator n=1 Tax=Streptomyces chartreusis TaxID=1969 RepID=UPI00362579A8